MNQSDQKGFSLVELLIAVAISGIVASVIIGFFISQQRSHTAQAEVTNMQQNIRAALGVMSRELRMAGYDPLRTGNMFFSHTGVSTTEFPGLSTITFRSDLDGDGVSTGGREEITYRLDTVKHELERKSSTGGNFVVLAENIEGLAFGYAYDSDGDGLWQTDGGEVIFALAGPPATGGIGPLDGTVTWHQINADGSTPSDTGILARANDIRAVKIWLLATTAIDDSDYTNPDPDLVGSQTIAAGGKKRKRLLETVVHCRNMGLTGP